LPDLADEQVAFVLRRVEAVAEVAHGHRDPDGEYHEHSDGDGEIEIA
jgi:hypothetical protein